MNQVKKYLPYYCRSIEKLVFPVEVSFRWRCPWQCEASR